MSCSDNTICAQFPCNALSPSFERALASLVWVDRVVLQDASPDERLATRAKEIRPDILVVKDHDPELRHRLMRWKDHTSDDFILWAMADEVWPEKLGEEIRALLNAKPHLSGIIIPHLSISFGREWTVGWPQCRVVRRDRLKFRTKDIHEMPSPDGEIFHMQSHYIHYPIQNMLLHWIKNYKYMVTEAANNPHLVRERAWFTNDNFDKLAFLRYYLKLNYRFLKTVWSERKSGLPGLLVAHCNLIRLVVDVFAKAEAVALMERNQEYEMVGHTEMPILCPKAEKTQTTV